MKSKPANLNFENHFKNQVSSVLANIWLSQWTSDPEIQAGNITVPDLKLKNQNYLTVYGALGAAQGKPLYFYLLNLISALQKHSQILMLKSLKKQKTYT